MSLRVRIVKQWLENFMPFRERVEVPMADLGLVHVRGENRVSKCSDANGVGKSALVVDGPAWIAYGETLRGLKGEAVVHRGSKKGPARGGWLLDVGGQAVTVERTARPSSLTISNQNPDLPMKDLQIALEQMLGYGLRTYRNAAVFGQGAFDRFRGADQSEQLRMLDEIQGLDFRAALKRAQDWARTARETVATIDADARRITDRISSLAAEIARAKDASAAFERAKAQRVAQAQQDVDVAARALGQRSQGISEAEAALVTVRKARAGLQKLRVDAALRATAEAGRVTATQTLGIKARECAAAILTRDRLKAQVKALLEHSACPSCRQTFNPALRKKVEKAFAPEVTAAEDAALLAMEEVALAKQGAESADQALASAPTITAKDLGQAEERGSDRALKAAEQALAGAKATVKAAEQALEAAQERLRASQRDVFSGAAVTGVLDRELVSLRGEHAGLEPERQRAEATVAVAEYWVEAFGDRGLRSVLFDTVADFLNDRLQYHLQALAAGEVDVSVSALSSLKGGGSREKISVASSWGWGGAGQGSGSHGQDRRVDLALFAALQDLAESRSAKPFPFRCWDEPTDALDSTGRELFAQWVAREARARGTGFLITHAQDLVESVRADHTWTVVLTAQGATVRQE